MGLMVLTVISVVRGSILKTVPFPVFLRTVMEMYATEVLDYVNITDYVLKAGLETLATTAALKGADTETVPGRTELALKDATTTIPEAAAVCRIPTAWNARHQQSVQNVSLVFSGRIVN